MEEQKTEQYQNQQTVLNFPGPIKILEEAWSIYYGRMKTFLGIMIVPFLANITVVILSMTAGFLNFSGGKESFAGFFPFLLVFFIATIIIMIIIQNWSQIALIYAIKDSKESIGIKESYKRALPKIIPFLWVSFLTGIIVLGGLIFFIVPGIIFALWFGFSIFILIDEDLHGTKALYKSKEYVKGKADSIFLCFLSIGLIIFFIVLVSSRVFGDFGNLATPIISLFINPLVTIYYFLVYKKAKELKNIKQG
jgi:hypothetical protein